MSVPPPAPQPAPEAAPKPAAWLVAISGPRIDPIPLIANSAGLTLGRHTRCDLVLPNDADQVSRYHAKFAHHDNSWHVADLESAWGTYLNGKRIPAGEEWPLVEGDILRITPWTFSLAPRPAGRGIQSLNDEGNSVVRTINIPADAAPAVSGDQALGLLLESATAIHAAANERELAEKVMDAACRGTGLQNAVMLRPTDLLGHYDIIAARGPSAAAVSPTGVPRAASPATGGMMTFSRSLLAAASTGNVAELQGGFSSSGDISQSIVQMRISAALCVPLMLGGSPAAYLYLDSRGPATQSLAAGASAYCSALGRMASLALANLKRLEMERRGAIIESDLRAAKTAQNFIFPKRIGKHGPLTAIGESRPGQSLSGDFFDVIPMPGNKIAVALGDVSGKGVAASVLMTAAQGFLHATLIQDGDLGRALTALNTYVCPRRPEGKFITLWAAVFDPDSNSLHYVDAGHGYALLRRAGRITRMDENANYPVGVNDDTQYSAATVPFNPADQLVVVSDGIIEQTGLVAQPNGAMERQEFGIAAVEACLARATEDAVADIFGAVFHHAGTHQLNDDATAVWIKG